MILNIVLLIFVFGAEKKKLSPYVAAGLLGGIKALIYALFTRNLLLALTMGAIFAGLAASFVFFLQRLNRREDRECPDVPAYTSAGSDTVTFRWEYIPLVILLLLIVGGEVLLR